MPKTDTDSNEGGSGHRPVEITSAAVQGTFPRLHRHGFLYSLARGVPLPPLLHLYSHLETCCHTHIAAMRGLSVDLRREYDQAVEVAPHLVKKETPFMHFLRAERFDAHLAAQRLVLYWKHRKEVFGDRWLFSMNQTGSGALNAQDIEILRTGFVVVIQRPQQGPILLYDMSRISHALGESAVRIAYYLVSTCSDELAQTDGVTILHVVTSAPRPPVETDPAPWRMILSSLPVQFKQVLLAQSVEEGREHLIESLAYQQARVTEFCSGFVTERVSSQTVEGTLRLLQNQGISPDCIPTTLGGQYEYSRFAEWIRRRVIAEDVASATVHQDTAQHSVIPAVPVAFLTTPPRAAASGGSSVDSAAAAEPGDEKSGESGAEPGPVVQDQEYLRRRNAMYVRRFYQRQNLAVESLQEQIRVWQTRNQAVSDANARLEGFLSQAQELVAMHGRLKDDSQ